MSWSWFSPPPYAVINVGIERLCDDVRMICESLSAGDGEWIFDNCDNVIHKRSRIKLSNVGGKWRAIRPHCIFTDNESRAIDGAVLAMIAKLVTPMVIDDYRGKHE